ncbi:MAG TPA: DNA-3-methyladenine glycosylase I [Desulfobacteraceae bacterium]|nr:DNA-3-methyladenine glycosylase I [Desulfobacteraceae bacterium]
MQKDSFSPFTKAKLSLHQPNFSDADVVLTIIYAYMQVVGMVNDPLISCFRYHEVMER